MKGKTKTILTVIIAILVFAIAIVGTVTFLKDDGEASATEEGVGNVLPVAGADGEQNPQEGLNENENPADQSTEENNENLTEETNMEDSEKPAETTTVSDNEEQTTENQGTTAGNRNPGSTNTRQPEPEQTTIEQERLVSTTLNWSGISLNSTIGKVGINYTNLDYIIKYYYNGIEDTTRQENGRGYLGEKINAPNKDDDGEWTLVNSSLEFTIESIEENIFEVYYAKPIIKIEKTRTTSVIREEGIVEPKEMITYTISATNTGTIEGNVTIADMAPEGTILVPRTITATGYDDVTESMLNDGLELRVPANGGIALVKFSVTVTANAGSDVINSPIVNGKEDKTNTVVNPVEKTVQVKPKTQTIQSSNVVIVLDSSSSMVTNNATGDPQNRTRLEVAKEVVNAFIDDLKLPDTSSEMSCSLTVITFNASARVIGSACTSEQASLLKANVNAIEYSGGTYMSKGVSEAEKELKILAQARPKNKNIVIFIGDGEPWVEADKNVELPKTSASLKNAKDDQGNSLATMVYAIGFDTDNSWLKMIASDESKYKTTRTSGSLSNIFSSVQEDLAFFRPIQSVDGLVILTEIYADNTHPILITVNGTVLPAIKTLPSDDSGYIILKEGKYYLDLTKFAAYDDIKIEYYSSN